MAIEKVINVKVNAREAIEGIKNLNEEISNTSKTTEKSNAAIGGLTSQIDSMTGGAISKFKGMTTALSSVAVGFKGIGAAIALSGLGLLILTIAAITAAFKGSEEGQNKFAKLTAVIGTVVGNLVDVLATLGEKLIYVFENPKKSLIEFGNLIKQNIINRFQGMLELFPAIGKAIKLVFEGEFAKAGEVAFNAVSKVSTGIEDTTGKLKGLVAGTKAYLDEQKKEIQQTKDVADMRAKAVKIDRALLVERAKMEEKIADLKLTSRDIDNFSAKERAEALKKAQLLEDSLLAKEQVSAKLKFDAQKLENTFSRTNTENADKEAAAEANLYNIGTRRKEQQKATLRELNRVNNEIRGNEKALNAEAQKEVEALSAANKKVSDEKAAASKKLVDEAKSISDKAIEENLREARTDIENLTAKYEQEKLLLEQSNIDTFDLEVQYLNDLNDLNLKQQQLEYDAKNKTAEDKKAVDKKTKDDAIALAKAEADGKKAIQDATINTVSSGIALLGQLAGKSKALQKAAIIAESALGIGKSIIATSSSNIATVAEGAALAIPTAGASVAAASSLVAANNIGLGIGIASNVAATAKALSALGGGGSAPSAGSLPAGGGAAAPSFNLVQGTGSNQIAQSLAGERQPIQAFVVSGNVTNQQELDRNSRSEGTV